jgi:hypothetical protein
MNDLNLKLDNVKRELYFLLLCKDTDTCSDIEVEVMYQLSKDNAIQSVLRTKNKY